jgi:hypothetical protein
MIKDLGMRSERLLYSLNLLSRPGCTRGCAGRLRRTGQIVFLEKSLHQSLAFKQQLHYFLLEK